LLGVKVVTEFIIYYLLITTYYCSSSLFPESLCSRDYRDRSGWQWSRCYVVE